MGPTQPRGTLFASKTLSPAVNATSTRHMSPSCVVSLLKAALRHVGDRHKRRALSVRNTQSSELCTTSHHLHTSFTSSNSDQCGLSAFTDLSLYLVHNSILPWGSSHNSCAFDRLEKMDALRRADADVTTATHPRATARWRMQRYDQLILISFKFNASLNSNSMLGLLAFLCISTSHCNCRQVLKGIELIANCPKIAIYIWMTTK